MTTDDDEAARSAPAGLVRRHLAFGWTGLGLTVLLGLVLEGLHAYKVAAYLDADATTARLLWRLGHAHLGAVSLVSLGFAFTLTRVRGTFTATSRWLMLGSVGLPLGFLSSGFGSKSGDPGLGIALVPPAAACLLIACLRTAATVLRASDRSRP